MTDKLAVIVATYPRVSEALADFGAVEAFFSDRSGIDMYDAAVIEKDANGKVRVVTRREEATAAGSGLGLGVGLALGALVAIFPPIALGAGLLIGGAGGAALGALAGHITGGMKRRDLHNVARILEDSEVALIVVTVKEVESGVAAALSRARARTHNQFRSNRRKRQKALERAQPGHPPHR